jgi:hypothetical protein
MTTPRHPKLLDMVAVTSSNPDELIEIGDVVTVVELLPPPTVSNSNPSTSTAVPAVWGHFTWTT